MKSPLALLLGIACLSLSSCATYKELRTKPGAVSDEPSTEVVAEVEAPVERPVAPQEDVIQVVPGAVTGFRVPDLTRDLPSNEQTAPAVIAPPKPRQDDTIVPNQ